MYKYVQIYISTTQRQDFFSLFCEHQFMKVCQQIIKKFKNPQYYILIIENLNIISYNLKLDREIVFFLSRAELNQIILSKNIEKEAESLDIYIQFLKSLVMRMKNTSYWKIFINSKYPIFPLLWQSLKYYNSQDKLIRTTVRSIVLEISRIKKFTIQAYLNNFPFIIFLAHECNYIFDIFKQMIKNYRHLNKFEDLMNDLFDEITFIEELSLQLPESTKNYLYNGFLYYFIKPLWNDFVNQQSQIQGKHIYHLIVYLLFNYFKDKTLKLIFYEIFFENFISREFENFFTSKFRQLKSYSFHFKERLLEKCFQMIQQHSEKCYDKMDNQKIQISSIIFRNRQFHDISKINLQSVKKSVNKSFLSKLPYIGNISWEKWLNQQLFSLSHGLGVNIERNKPIEGNYTQNIYYSYPLIPQEQKKKSFFKPTINMIHTKLQRFIQSDKKSYYIKMKVYKHLLKNSLNIDKILIIKILQQMGVYLYLLDRNKSIKNIKITIQLFEILNQMKGEKYLMEYLSKQSRLKVTRQINNLSKSHALICQNKIFKNGWNGYVQVFEEQQILRNSKGNEQNRIELNQLMIQQEASQQKQYLKQIYFYYLMRRIVHILSISKNENSYFQIFNNLKRKSEFEYNMLKDITFKIKSVQYYLTAEFQHFQIKNAETDQSLIQKSRTRILMIQQIIKQNKYVCHITINSTLFELEFDSQKILQHWIKSIKSLQQQIKEFQISSLIQLFETIEQL